MMTNSGEPEDLREPSSTGLLVHQLAVYAPDRELVEDILDRWFGVLACIDRRASEIEEGTLPLADALQLLCLAEEALRSGESLRVGLKVFAWSGEVARASVYSQSCCAVRPDPSLLVQSAVRAEDESTSEPQAPAINPALTKRE